jgi:hypothetical protein
MSYTNKISVRSIIISLIWVLLFVSLHPVRESRYEGYYDERGAIQVVPTIRLFLILSSLITLLLVYKIKIIYFFKSIWFKRK